MRCQQIQPLLSEYIDNRLSARDTWEVDKHLADCNACALVLNEMRRTVQVVSGAPRFEASGDFMEKLQARLAQVEPVPSRRAWLSNLGELFRPRLLPAWGAAVATCALALMIVMPKLQSTGGETPHGTEIRIVEAAKTQNVAISASDPLGDISTANLVAHSGPEIGSEVEASQ